MNIHPWHSVYLNHICRRVSDEHNFGPELQEGRNDAFNILWLSLFQMNKSLFGKNPFDTFYEQQIFHFNHKIYNYPVLSSIKRIEIEIKF